MQKIPDRQAEWRRLRGALVAVDVVALMLAVSLASVLWPLLDILFGIGGALDSRHLVVSALAIVALLLVFRINGLYDFDRVLAGTVEYARVANSVTFGLFAAIAVSFFAGGAPLISRSWLVLIWGSSILLVCTGRFGLRRIVRRLRRRGSLRTRVAIVGASSFGVAIASQLLENPDEGIDLAGFFDEYIPLGHTLIGSAKVIGRPGDLVLGQFADVADEFILVPEAIPHQHLEQLTRLMIGQDEPVVRLAVSSVELLTNGVLVAERASVPLLTLQRARITGIDALMKRALDITVGGLLWVGFLPIVIPAVLRAALTSRSRLVEREVVFGERGWPVTVHLFSRRVSGWLPVRGWPALLAVLAGRVSLVGPRPVRIGDSSQVPAGLEVTAVKPGLIGPWRLAGPKSSLAEQATGDLSYVRNYTIWSDLHIILESLQATTSTLTSDAIGRWHESLEPIPASKSPRDTANAGRPAS